MVKLPEKESKNVEFKLKLSNDYHLKKGRREELASQMNYLLEAGNGYAVYIIGVDDKGNPGNINELEFQETLQVLSLIANENKAEIFKVEKFLDNGSLIGKIVIRRKSIEKSFSHITIGLGGHVHHGKSTLISTLITNKKDLDGKNWLYLNVLPHEIERRLTADLHYTFLAFKGNEPIFFKNPLDKNEKSKIIETADKIVSFIDNVGHEAWLYSTIRGLVGQNIDYGILVIDCIDGITHITKENLGIMLAMDLPIIVCLTKIDKANEEKIKRRIEEIEELFKRIGRIPFLIKSEKDCEVVIDKINVVVPIIKVSSVTLEGYDLLRKLLLLLPERERNLNEPFLMYIDKVYNITGTGCVVSGTVKKGSLKAGSELLIGPLKDGSFRKVRASSIEMHYGKIEKAKSGFVVGIALKGIESKEVKRGMILCDPSTNPKPIKSFEAEIFVLTHPTRISDGYEPVLHINTISEAAKIKLLDKDYLKSGESGKAIFSFKYNSYYIEEGEKFVFREGKTKGIGKIIKVV